MALVGSIAGLEGRHVHHDLLAWDTRLVQVHPRYCGPRGYPYRHEMIATIHVVGSGRAGQWAQMSWVPSHALDAIRLVSNMFSCSLVGEIIRLGHLIRVQIDQTPDCYPGFVSWKVAGLH
jgi:hypothetical protein